jgi:hypothetical protein
MRIRNDKDAPPAALNAGVDHRMEPTPDPAALRFARLTQKTSRSRDRLTGPTSRFILLLIVANGLTGTLTAQNTDSRSSSDATPNWKPIEFLLGNWIGTGGGAQTGSGQGAFSFEPQLNQHIIVRRNFAEYSSGPQAGSRHDDLMIIYLDPAAGSASPDRVRQQLRAIDWDTEGHVIQYNLATPAANVAVFESDGAPSGPRYRLTYTLNGKNLDGKFEIAAPGAEFKTYLTWTSIRNRR